MKQMATDSERSEESGVKSELDEFCERISMRPEEPCEHKRTLTFETYADGSVLVTCAEHPLLALVFETRGRAFEAAWLLADEMEARRAR